MLTSRDTIPVIPRRILVAGVTGVGKTTFCRSIAASTTVPHTEIDALFHGAGWVVRADFVADVLTLAATDAWVTEWQYSSARALLAARADTLVWLDFPVREALSRVIRRTVHRARTQEVLWNGNTEKSLWHALLHRDGILRWAFTTQLKYKSFVPNAGLDHPHLQIVRLRNQQDADAWLLGPLASAIARQQAQ